MAGPRNDDRRRHPRRDLVKEVYCYVDGVRLDGWSLNASASGLFLGTPIQGEVPLGASVALVFKDQEHSRAPVILFGRVMRRQAGTPEGLGLAWERAVTPGEPADLVAVLRGFLGIEAEGIHRADAGDGRGQRCVYSFAEAPARASPPSVFLDRPGAATWPRSPGPGVVSRQVDRRLVGIATELGGWMRGPGGEVPVAVHRLGFQGLALRPDPAAPLVEGADVTLRLEIRTSGSVLPVTLRCRAVAPDSEPGAPAGAGVLEILERDEGEHAGILDRYLKWLHLRSQFAG